VGGGEKTDQKKKKKVEQLLATNSRDTKGKKEGHLLAPCNANPQRWGGPGLTHEKIKRWTRVGGGVTSRSVHAVRIGRLSLNQGERTLRLGPGKRETTLEKG